MKDRTKNTPQVLLRRALLVLLDAAIVAFSFYFALLLRADGAVEAGWLFCFYQTFYVRITHFSFPFLFLYFVAGIFRAVLPFLREISVYVCPDSVSPDNRFLL